MTTQPLVDVQDYVSPADPIVESSTIIGIVAGSTADEANRQLPEGVSLPAVNTPTLIRSLIEAREVFGWLSDPVRVSGNAVGVRNGRTYNAAFVPTPDSPSGVAAARIAGNSMQRSMEGIFSKASPIVVAVLFDDTLVAGATRDTAISNALLSLRDANVTGFTPNILIVPEELWDWGAAAPDVTKNGVYDAFEETAKDLGALPLAQMPPITRANAIGVPGNTWAVATGSTESAVWRVYPSWAPDFQAQRFDITPFLASALAERDTEGIGIAANPRSIRLSGGVPFPRITHAATSATVDSAILRARNVSPIVTDARGTRPIGTLLGVPAGSTRRDRFVNVYRVKQEVKRGIVRLAEEASELNARAAREFMVQKGEVLMSQYRGRGWMTDPNMQLDPELDKGGNNVSIYTLATYMSVNPAQLIGVRVGPSG